MNFLLDNEMHKLDLFFEPIVFKGINTDKMHKIAALEMLSRISNSSGKHICPSSFFFSIPNTLKNDIFLFQINWLRERYGWIMSNDIIYTINVDFENAKLILASKKLKKIIRSFNHNIALEISEFFLPNTKEFHNSVKERVGLIQKLQLICPLWLDDFGVGLSNLDMIDSDLFSVIKLSQKTISQLVLDSHSIFFLKELTEFINKTGCLCVLEGIANIETYNKIKELNVMGYQGYLWPGESSIIKLLNNYLDVSTRIPDQVKKPPQ